MVAIWRRWTRGASDLKRLLAGESGKGDVDSDVLLADLMIVLWKIVDWQKPKCCGREREEVGVGVSRGIYCVAAEEKPVSWAPGQTGMDNLSTRGKQTTSTQQGVPRKAGQACDRGVKGHGWQCLAWPAVRCSAADGWQRGESWRGRVLSQC